MGEVADDIGKGFSDVYKDVIEGSKQIGEYLGYGTTSDKTKRGVKKRKIQSQESAESAARRARGPNLDDAQREQVEVDRLRRRRGVLGNIYGGANVSAPSVGTKTLLGS